MSAVSSAGKGMSIALVAPSSVPFVIGGAENLWWSLLRHINENTPHRAELIKLPSPEGDFRSLVESYAAFSRLDLSHFDQVISTKYPAWMIRHPNHVVYLQHRLRGLYDTYHFCGLPDDLSVDAPAQLRALWDWMATIRGRRDSLDTLLAALRAVAEVDGFAPWLALPSPFVRRAVHTLDSIGLATSQVSRYAAISKTVARRQDYFPAGASVHAVSHPSGLPVAPHGRYDYFFTASRLDGPKRIEMMVRAMASVRGDVPLVIAGTGPEEARLKELAKNDPRIRFVGYVNDESLSRWYADARAVLYVPYDEDMGLITFEAMQAAKPVVTVRDSGGPTEFVEDGVNGYCVDPEPAALARALQALTDSPELAQRMGQEGARRVAAVTWNKVCEALIHEPEPVAAPRGVGAGERKRITVLSTFPSYPPKGGGQARIYHLWRRVAQQHDVTIVALGPSDSPGSDAFVAPGLREIVIPKTVEQDRHEQEVSASVDWVPCADSAFALAPELTPDYVRVAGDHAARSDIVVASHPYAYPAVRGVRIGELWYEAHNDETRMKQAMYPATAQGEALVQAIDAIERELCERAQRVICVSESDLDSLSQRYRADRSKFFVAANGVDLDSVRYRDPDQRRELQQRLGLSGRAMALVLASWHGPNLDAVETVLTAAPSFPEVDFVVVGSAGGAFAGRELPANVSMVGAVSDEEKDLLLGAATVALNPMASGGGSNLKLLDYMASGAPVLTSEYGRRGVAGADDLLWLYDDSVESFVRELRAFCATSDEQRRIRVPLARDYVERNFSWSIIVGEVLRRII
ncbi:glycosyltransferase family 4 protein [Lysobacter enzymogenes]|uniref:glycosyltransferase family 4 protein n=1 Tax=Lysobacter enzymogenes TaxID=69 RepID=UPI00089D510A|nr:glycosyltransferase [Lysobacter enzymogenes]SDW23336.1 Glycosyltransferase involved in cell wall bisynthesis [Lysobacter enzymogenes]